MRISEHSSTIVAFTVKGPSGTIQCLECSQSTLAVGLESQNDVDVLYLFKPLEFHSIRLRVSEHIAV